MFCLNDAFDELNSHSVLALLEFFCRHSTRSFYVREAARDSGLSVGTCNSALKLLAKKGFLHASRRGNQLHYSLDALNPVVRQFRVFLNVLALEGVVDAIKESCEKIILYGSRAYGDEAEDSDFDLLVLTSGVEDVKKILSQKKFERLSALVVDPKRLLALRLKEKPFYDKMMSGIELWRVHEHG